MAAGLTGIAALDDVILCARKPSTRLSYQYKWKKYLSYLESCSIPLRDSGLKSILAFLLQVKDLGLKHSSLRVYLSAISAFHAPIDGKTVFSHPFYKQFLKGLRNLRPDIKVPPPTWDLPLVLRTLTRHPFEPMATCDLRLSSWKTAFLVAITSARRVSELVVLRRSPLYLVFLPHSVRLRPDIKFLPKVNTDFHVSSHIILPDFFPSPASPRDKLYHTLDVKRALLFYLDRTKFPDRADSLFVRYSNPHRGSKVSSQRLSHWLSELISLTYSLARVPPPKRLTAHSTRAVAASTAFLQGVSLGDICAAATWSSPTTFIRHYAIDVQARQTAPLARAVLSTVSC